MKKSLNMLPKILSGEKTIESRWYRSKRAPWDRIKKGDRVYFKNSGEAVRVKALVSDVLQFVITDSADARAIIKKYGKQICLSDKYPYFMEIIAEILHPHFLGKSRRYQNTLSYRQDRLRRAGGVAVRGGYQSTSSIIGIYYRYE
jgi:hypothetical protein